jgi:hypothetical protein
MQLRRPIPAKVSFFSLLAIGWALAASVAWRPQGSNLSTHRTPDLSLASKAGNTHIGVWISPGESRVNNASGVSPTGSDSPKRGIRPPWRENAIPELRRQPGQKSRTVAA